MDEVQDLLDKASLLHRERKFEEAKSAYQKLLAITPLHSVVLREFAVCLAENYEFEDALSAITLAISLEPQHGGAYVTQSAILGQLGRPDDSFRAIEKAVQKAPYAPAAHWNYSLGLLQRGDFTNGWREYRWGVVFDKRRHRTLQEPWRGEHLGPLKTLLVWSEQGSGDTVQFCRCLRYLREITGGARIVFECQEDLLPALYKIEGADEVIVWPRDGGIYCEWDAHTSLMDLPGVLGWTVNTIPQHTTSYIPIDPDLSQAMSQFLDQSGSGKKKVGVVWKGSPGHSNDRIRSASLELFKPLFEVEGVQFYSIQPGQPTEDSRVVDLGDSLNTWASTAALLANLDLVISVDTCVAHMAGAIGTKVWNLLPLASEWRWFIDRIDTPWYPSMTLYRQKERGDWEEVIRRVANDLRSL